MLTVLFILAIAATIMTLVHAAYPGKIALWVPVLLLCIIELARVIPFK